jgi:hypothetical protein
MNAGVSNLLGNADPQSQPPLLFDPGVAKIVPGSPARTLETRRRRADSRKLSLHNMLRVKYHFLLYIVVRSAEWMIYTNRVILAVWYLRVVSIGTLDRL